MARGRIRVEDGNKRIRVVLGGEVIADTIRSKLVWEKPYYPTYYVPIDDVADDALVPTGATKRSPSRGDAELFDVKSNRRTAEQAAYHHADSPIAEIRDHVAFEWSAMDAWFEEDVEVHVHPRDPYTRVDVLPSSRHVEVLVDGVKVADSHHPRLLFETGLPTRYYLPKTDVRMDLLTPTDTQTHCPYKGTAEYWSATIGDAVHEDLVWSYRTPLPESHGIGGLVAFYNEKVDIVVDGELQGRSKTVFS
ncbi:MAG: DUF427 domain-containing protein [Actinomycetota bacterium]